MASESGPHEASSSIQISRENERAADDGVSSHSFTLIMLAVWSSLIANGEMMAVVAMVVMVVVMLMLM